MSPEEAFGFILRELRVKAGFSQEDLGFESGYHRTYISLLERGLKSPSLATIFRLARVLNIPPQQLIERVVEKTEAASKQRRTKRKHRR